MQSLLHRHQNRLTSPRNKNLVPADVAHEITELSSACAALPTLQESRKMIQTGKQPISVATYCAIMSISLVVNLPGLAVTPMLGSLSEIFPHTTQLEKQLLTILPNVIIIPFVLLSGKLSLSRHKNAVVVSGLVLFTLCGVAYMIAGSMAGLIIISCLLGCGAGLLIPFSPGLISDTFAGPYRMRAMGVKSGVSNLALVVATFAVGWLSHGGDWHLPLLVYLISLIPLCLAFRLPRQETAVATASSPTPVENAHMRGAVSERKIVGGLYVGRLAALIGVYAFITFGTIAVTYYCPFLIEKRAWSTSLTGTVTAIFYLFMLIPGFTLGWMVRWLRSRAFFITAVMMAAGLGLFAFFTAPWSMCVGSALAGLGYGICQPLIYDKASDSAASGRNATLALSIVLAANYIAIVLTPFIIDGMRLLLHAEGIPTFAFLMNFILLSAYAVLALLCRKSFAFNVSQNYY